ncbi:MAG: O-antigen ligase family protein [Acidobacteriota bacterium]|nr:O-antigen ligase family protein [Acidobacteriota bacterium]
MVNREAWVWLAAVFLLQVGFSPDLLEPGRGFRLVLVSAMVALVALRCRKIGRGASLPPAVAGAVLVLLAITVVGALLAPGAERCSVFFDGWQSVASWLLLLAGATASEDGSDAGVDRALAGGCAMALVPAGLWGLAQAWLGWSGPGPLIAPPAGPWFNRNVAAQALVILVPLALSAAVVPAHRWRRRWLSLACAGLGVMFLVATRSRGGWVAAVVGWGLALGLVMAGRIRREGPGAALRPLLAPAALLAACGVVAAMVPVAGKHPLPAVGRVVEMTLEPVAGGTMETRRALWVNTGAMIREHPWLGVGAGRWNVVYPLFQRRVEPTPGFGLRRQPRHAHNEVLEFAAELGVPGVGLLVLLVGAALWRLGRRAGSGDAGAGLRLAGLGAVVVHAQVSFPLHAPATAALFWIVAGSALRPEGGARPRPGRAGARWAPVVPVLLLLLAVAGTWAAGRDYRARRHLARAAAAAGQGRCAEALEQARQAWAASCHRDHRGRSAVVIWTCEKNPEASLAFLEPALAAFPHRLELLLDTGARRIKAGRLDQAEAAYRHALALKPDLGRAWLGLAMTLDRQGRPEPARDACRRALAVGAGPAARAFCGGLGVYD